MELIWLINSDGEFTSRIGGVEVSVHLYCNIDNGYAEEWKWSARVKGTGLVISDNRYCETSDEAMERAQEGIDALRNGLADGVSI